MGRPRKMGLASCRCKLSSSHKVPLGVSGGLEPWIGKPEPIWVFTFFFFLLLLLEMLTCGLALFPLAPITAEPANSMFQALGCHSCSLNSDITAPYLERQVWETPFCFLLCQPQLPLPRAGTRPKQPQNSAPRHISHSQAGPQKPACSSESRHWRMGERWDSFSQSPPPDSGIVTHKAGLLPRSVGPCLQGNLMKATQSVSCCLPPVGHVIIFIYCCRIEHKEWLAETIRYRPLMYTGEAAALPPGALAHPSILLTDGREGWLGH